MKSKKNRYFPVYVDLSEKKIVIIGGGSIAARRIHTLESFVDEVTVIAPEAREEIRNSPIVSLKEKYYERDDILDADIVLACTGDEEVNRDIYSACRCLGIRVNDCSDQNKCDFFFPAVICDGDIVISVSSGGRDHRKVRAVREKIEAFLETGAEDADAGRRAGAEDAGADAGRRAGVTDACADADR